ncbi:MAG TPA: response regulator transcription factor [Candidatus Binatia bacterium]|nr:response regulator transcription factor [Candidatus Binatia bacterium]
MVRIVIGASSKVVRLGLESLVETEPSFKLVGSFSLGDALARLADLQPDVAVLDLASPVDEAMVFSLEQEPAPPRPALVVLSDEPGSFPVAEAFRAGVRAILPRRPQPAELIAALQASAAGLVVLHPDALEPALSPAEMDTDEILTPREIEVLRMIAEGSGNKLIAARLEISDHTVKFHVASIFTKLGAGSRTEAVTIGIRKGLLMI